MKTLFALYRTYLFLLFFLFGTCIFSSLEGLNANVPVGGPIFKSQAFHPISIVQSSDALFINFATDCGASDIFIFNSAGEVVAQYLCSGTANTAFSIDVLGWNSGIYEMEIHSSTGGLLFSDSILIP